MRGEGTSLWNASRVTIVSMIYATTRIEFCGAKALVIRSTERLHISLPDILALILL